jgi:hypothetical protein
MAKLVVCCATCKADMESISIPEFRKNFQGIERENLLTITPSPFCTEDSFVDLGKKIEGGKAIKYIESVLKDYFDNYRESNYIEDWDYQGTSKVWVENILMGIGKCLEENKDLVIYYPETFLDKEWLGNIWNIFGNLVNKDKLNIYLYTLMDYNTVCMLNWEYEVEHTSVTRYTGNENEPDKTIIDVIVDFFRKLKKK